MDDFVLYIELVIHVCQVQIYCEGAHVGYEVLCVLCSTKQLKPLGNFSYMCMWYTFLLYQNL